MRQVRALTRRIGRSLIILQALFFLEAAGFACPALADTPYAGLTRGAVGELELFASESQSVQISGESYALAPGLKIVGPLGESLGPEDLQAYEFEWIYFRYRTGSLENELVEIQIGPDDGD